MVTRLENDRKRVCHIGAERTDEELAAEDVAGNQLAVIEFPAWARIRAAGLEHAVLVAAEHSGLAAVNGLINQAGSVHAAVRAAI